MTDNDLNDFNELMVAMSETYRQPLSALAVRMYWEILLKYDFVRVRKAVMAHIAHTDRGRFMPKPADLVLEINGGIDPSFFAGCEN